MTNRFRASLAGLVLLAMSSVAAGQQGATSQADFAKAMEEANKLPDTPGDGPYPAVMELDPALPDHVIYRPADLKPFAGGKLAVFAWGNGGCADDGAKSAPATRRNRVIRLSRHRAGKMEKRPEC